MRWGPVVPPTHRRSWQWRDSINRVHQAGSLGVSPFVVYSGRCGLQGGCVKSVQIFNARPFEQERGVRIYVGNLSYQVTDDELRQAFEAFGQVSSASVIMDKFSGQSKGFGFV